MAATSLTFFFMASSMCFFFLLSLQSLSYDQPNTMVPAVHDEMLNSRKVLKKWSDTVEVVFSRSVNVTGEGEEKKKKTQVERELREAPMGPDPLHHHGASPISRGGTANNNNRLHPANP